MMARTEQDRRQIMGGGTWSRDIYDRVTADNVKRGTTFAYTASARRRGVYKAHENLEIIKGGKAVTRESRDSDEHPESTPIVIGFDVTGSMGENPAILQKALKGLFGMLVRKDVVSDPQIAIAAYGDTECDRVPVQFSQFESDNRIDDNLDNVFIEGGGGGNNGEMSTALAWFTANNVVTDAWEKRHKKGYLFLIGDEKPLSVSKAEGAKFLAMRQPFEITPEVAFGKVQEKWEVFFLLVDNYAAEYQGSREAYGRLLGKDHVITLQTTDSAPAVIASVIGLHEKTVNATELSTELVDAGFAQDVASAAIVATTGIARTTQREETIWLVREDKGYGDLAL